MEKEVEPFYEQWDENSTLPKEIIKKAADAGMLALCVGAPWPKNYIAN